MKKTILSLLLAVCIITISSCGSKPREKGTPIASTKEAVDALTANKKDNMGKRFSITGYLYYSAGANVYVTRPQSVSVYAEAGRKGNIITDVEMAWFENGKNSVFVPQDGGGDASKTIFYDNEGKALSGNDKVMISFELDDVYGKPTQVRIDKTN